MENASNAHPSQLPAQDLGYKVASRTADDSKAICPHTVSKILRQTNDSVYLELTEEWNPSISQ